MHLKKENYTHMGTTMPVLLGIFMCLFVLEINASNLANPPGSCRIDVLQEPRPTSRAKGTRHVRSVKSSYRSADWDGLINSRILDDEAISTSLGSGITSSTLILNNFNFKIPTGSEIASMEIYVDGKAVGDSLIDVRTKDFYLLDASGNAIGDNINNLVSLGEDWGDNTEFHQWRYGFNSFNWGGILSTELLNSPNFGLSLDIKNHSEFPVEVYIDKIEIVVQYKPTYTVCTDELHKCIAFFGPRSSDIVGYTWTLPLGFKELDDSEPEVFNLLIQDEIVPGVYEVCVDIQYSSWTEQCCRVFEMVDCTPSSIGDKVWEDIDGNGVQDDGEPGVDGIQLELYNEIDQVVDNTISGSDGSYSFSNIDPGCYYIRASNLNGYIPTIGEANVLDGSNGYATTDYFTLDSDTSLAEIDLGLIRPAKISGTIWHDANADGTFGDEPTFEGVTVSLVGPDHTRTTTTDGSGNYTFDDLVPGDFKLTVTLLDNYEYTLTGIGAEDVNSDLNDMGMVSIAGLISGDEVSDIDGGMFKRGTIGNYVWYDFNVNGIQDEGEYGIGGVQVMLMNADGLVTSSTTDASGSYSLRGVKPDHYFLAFSINNNYIISLPNVGDEEGLDSDVESLQDAMRTAEFEFSSCDTLSDLDAGFIFKPGTIEGLVWSDDDRDGQRQPDESRSLSTVVTLYNDANEEIESKTVDGDRSYFFDRLQPGDFYVQFDAIEDHVFSNANVIDDATDSDITDVANGTTDLITITPELLVSNVDGGYEYLLSSITGTIWEDEDRDNKKGAEENNFGGLEVNLYFSDGELVQATTTKIDGTYKFEELRKNDYYIRFGEVEDYLFVTPKEGGESENSKVTQSIAAGSTDMISLFADTDLTDINAGYILEVGTIKGEAWEDEDLDGANNDDVLFEDIEVKLFDENDNELLITTTDRDGAYTFELVPVGDYYVYFELPQRYIYADANASGDESLDSDIDGSNGDGTTEEVSIDNQDDEVELDGGYVINEGRVEGVVWKDNDEDGQRQDSEGGMEGIEISLIDNTGSEIENTMTSNEGTYAFEEITAGDYYVKLNIPADNIFTLPNQGDDATDSDISEANGDGTSDTFEVQSGRRTTSSDAGSVDNFGSIYGVAWCDANEDGILESNEELIGGINVDLLNEEGTTIESTTTSTYGAYSFLEVPAGSYYLVFEDETDKEFTEANVGDDELVSSAINSSLTAGSTFIFRVGTGNKGYIRNAGYQYLPGSISGQAWKDDNSNAANDDNSPFSGITVTLLDESNNEVSSTSTNASGEYGFEDIRRGAYYIVFGGDDDYLMISSSQSEDSDISQNTMDGGTDILHVVANRETEKIDGGYLYARGSVAGNAWIDIDDNGLNDDNAPLPEVAVTLNNESGEVSSTTTDGNGNYVFSDIYFGDYYIVFAAQVNYLFTRADAGDDNIDSDITGTNGEGSTESFQILPSLSTENIDGGYFLAVGSVTGNAWVDDNDNATNDDGNGFEGIEVTLYSSNGEKAVATTNSTGDYHFENVLQGTYTVAFDTRDDYDFVAPNIGDEDKDSDITEANGDGSTDEITVHPREETKYVDGGYVLGKGSISGLAWIDDNDNALNDDDQRIEGVVITMFTASGERTTTTTNAQGEYIFEDVFPGVYTIAFDTREDYVFVAPDAGDDTIDSDITGAYSNGSTDEITVGPRQEVTNIDGGYLLQTGSISGYAWIDSNVNDIDDEGIVFEGIEVTLFTVSGDRTTATTDADGYYIFEDIVPGIYTIAFETKDDYEFSNPNSGEEDQDSDVTGANGDGSTNEITVNPNEDVMNVDAGYIMLRGGISGTAWKDENRNGINDGEPPFANVTVTLYTEDGTELYSEETNENGTFIFDALLEGDYYLVFESKDNFKFTTEGEGGGDEDSDVTGSNGVGSTDKITLSPGQDLDQIDAGYVIKLGQICGFVWNDDATENNIYDQMDDLVSSIEIELRDELGNIIQLAVTDNVGAYCFDELHSGNYDLRFLIPERKLFVTPNQGNNIELVSSVTELDSGLTDIIVLAAGEVASKNAGIRTEKPSASICGKVWKENNNDDIYNEGESLLAGVGILLLSTEGAIISTSKTDNNGQYCFEGLEEGNYIIHFEKKEDEFFVKQNIGDDLSIDSDVVSSGDTLSDIGITDIITLGNGQQIKNIDAGIYEDLIVKLGSVSGVAWEDVNKNNINDDDKILAGIEVRLLRSNGEEIANAITDNNGGYSFNDLEDGSYYIIFENRDLYTYALPSRGADDTIDSDVTGSSGDGSTDPFEISLGSDIMHIDCGLIIANRFYKITGTTWLDLNNDDIYNEESIISDVDIKLLNEQDEIIETSKSDQDGKYCFNDIVEGNYKIAFANLSSYNFVESNIGNDNTIDSDVVFINDQEGTTEVFNLDMDVNSIDAGYTFIDTIVPNEYSVSGQVWIDENVNHVNDDDKPLEGVEVKLYTDQNQLISSTVTDVLGYFSFLPEQVGSYYVVFEVLEDYQFSVPDIGDNDETDSDVISINDFGGYTSVFSLNNDISNIGAGYILIDSTEQNSYSISGKTWDDENLNHLNDDNSPIAGIGIILTTSEDVIFTSTLTDEFGCYAFNNIPEGSYYVIFSGINGYNFSEANIGEDEKLDADVITVENSFGKTKLIDLNADRKYIDAGYANTQPIETGQISGVAWRDINGNNVNDDNMLLEGITVSLIDDQNTVVVSKITNPQGYYLFDNIEEGVYRVQFEILENSQFTDAGQGGDDSKDSDVISPNGFTASLDIVNGAEFRNIDAGYKHDLNLYCIGGQAWVDIDKDNIRNEDEALVGIQVILRDSLNSVFAIGETNEEGYYLFDDVLAGYYFIEFELPSNYEFVIANAGNDKSIDSDVVTIDIEKGVTELLKLDRDQKNIDAGYTKSISTQYGIINGKTWRDLNENHINDDDLPLEGVEVLLYDSEDKLRTSTTTNSDGSYVFVDVPEGEYSVQFEVLEKTLFSNKNQGEDRTIDSDVDPATGFTDKIDVVAGENLKDIDAGYIHDFDLYSIQGQAWVDENKDNVNTENNGLGEIQVLLFDTLNAVRAISNTTVDGSYQFEDIEEGNYYLEFELPIKYDFVEANAGSDVSIDSDVINKQDGKGLTDVLALSQDLINVDAGYCLQDTTAMTNGIIAGVVWSDDNKNSKRENIEPKISDIEVKLLSLGGEELRSTRTNGEGEYLFENIVPGEYRIKFVVSDDQLFVQANLGNDKSVDSDVVTENGETDVLNLESGMFIENIDAGLISQASLASLCGNVWIDINENALREEDEDIILGLRIYLYNRDGDLIDSTQTTTGGYFSITNIAENFYYLEFDTEGDYKFTTPNVGEDESKDSDVTEALGEGTTDIFFASGKITLSAGLIPETGSYISGHVWGDRDENNSFNQGDLLLEDQEVYLVNRFARIVASTETNMEGYYQFDLEQTGEYAVLFAKDSASEFVEPNASGDDETDSDVIDIINLNGNFGTTGFIKLNTRQRIRYIDAGYVMTSDIEESISGVVWSDQIEDGIRQDEEPLLDGQEVKLFNAEDVLIATTTTDVNGVYTFTNLTSGDYYIQFIITNEEFVEPNAGNDDARDSDVIDIDSGKTATFFFEQGVTQSYDAGIVGGVQLNTICGIVWNDEDQNSLNNDEQGRRDVKVYLEKDGEAVDSTTTAADGTYTFTNLEVGTYRILVESVDGYDFVQQDEGDDDTIDSDVNDGGRSPSVTVDGKVTIDAGVNFSVVGITGKVWGDRNEDNVFGEEDILIEGHTVFLLNRTARVIQTTTTGADGTYRFENVAPGMYGVFFDVGVDDMFVEANAGEVESADSDVTEVITQIGPYAATPFFDYEENGSLRNIDAGLIRTPSSTGFVAGVVWLDNEQDGIRQEGEELFSGIDVTLFTIDGNESATATTDDNGAYEFDNVSPGEYYVVFTIVGREFVAANQGDDDRVDSDVEDLGAGRTTNFDVEIDVTISMDAGIQPVQAGVCGVVWFDFNENGQRDNDEMGIPNNEIKLFSTSGEEVAVTDTDNTGAYSFSDVAAGDYYVHVFLEGALAFTEMKMGDESSDSDITEANGDGTSDAFTYESGLTKVDAGQISIVPSFISGKVWEDKDGDNIFNNDDEVVGGLNVYLQFDGAFIDTAVTEPDGTYIFESLPVGSYVVLFEQREGMFFTLANIPDEENMDSDVLGTIEIGGENFGFTEDLYIGSGQVKVNVDAGITVDELNPGSITGEVWLDENDDAKKNDDEGPVEGVVVTLYDETGGTVGMLEIPADGNYSFENLAPGLYAIQFNIPSEFNFVDPDQGDENENSDVFMFDGPIGVTNVINVGDGEDIENIDAGLKPITVNFSTIGDQVWLDVDEDGILDPEEIGMNDVTVELYQAGTDNLVASMVTIDHPELRDPGFYEFADLPTGDYYLKFKLPNGYIFSNPRMGTELIKDSDVTGANGTGTTNTVTVDRIKMTDIDVGAIQTTNSFVGDFVFNDKNSNGVQDTNEDGINNIRVRIFDAEDRQVAQTFTQYNRAMNRGGYFSFKVEPGTYYLKFDISQGLSFTTNDQGDNDERDSDVNGENGFGTTSLFEIGVADTDLSLDAGLITEPANLGNYLWVDANSNGVQDADEDGLNDVEVSLYDKDNNLMISTTTSSVDGHSGYYRFQNISVGQYYIGFDLPEDYVSTVSNVGGNDAEDSDITDVFGKGTTSLFTLSSGEDELDVDGGVVLSSSIGDYVWEDTNGDGIQDNDESGAEGIFISLTNAAGDLVDTTRTDVRGEYIFDGLRAGQYTLDFDLPIDRAITSQDSGSDDDGDSDIDKEGNSPTIVLGYDDDIDNVDLGLVSNSVAFDSSVDNELIANVYPNPTIRFITISTANIYQEDTEIKDLQIFNNKGALVRSYNDLKILKSGGTGNYEIDLQGVQPGIYFIKAKVGRLNYQKKLILVNN